MIGHWKYDQLYYDDDYYDYDYDDANDDVQHNHRDDDWALKIFHLNKLSSDYNDDGDDDDYDYDDVNDNQLSYVNHDDLIGSGKFWFLIAEHKESSHCSAVKDPNREAEGTY